MAPKVPITGQVIDRLSYLRRLMHSYALNNDGVIDDDEQEILDEIDEAQGTVTWWDQWRKEAVYLLDHGCMIEDAPSYHHERNRGEIVELYPDVPKPAA